jgi:predicted RND superfamily exporter protein
MGVCGFLQIWGSDLDSVSMGCIVMAIGLAVDFSVHICYRYHRSSKATPSAKLIDTLEVVGWPVLQAALSTLFGLASLPLIHAYLVRVFFQTVVLVNVIGLLHGLLWLPQMISSLDRLNRVPIRVYCQQQQQIECDKNREKACKLEEEVDTEEEQRPHEQ